MGDGSFNQDACVLDSIINIVFSSLPSAHSHLPTYQFAAY
jgi:hypothetical protein